MPDRLDFDDDGELQSARESSARHAGEVSCTGSARRRRARALRPCGLRLLGGGLPSDAIRRLPRCRHGSGPGDVPDRDVRRLPPRRRQPPDREPLGGRIRIVGISGACSIPVAHGSRMCRSAASDLTVRRLSNARCSKVDLRGARLDGLQGVGSLRGAIIGASISSLGIVRILAGAPAWRSDRGRRVARRVLDRADPTRPQSAVRVASPGIYARQCCS